MSDCKIDHSLADVKKKYEDQKELLPLELVPYFESFLQESPNQAKLNEVFHLLKKYDLAAKDDQSKRNEQLQLLLVNQ